ncbi:MAG: type IV secretory system conjugative DNA transfer family protein [Clostridia bacterium]|nr:type IV secretory system conjugative DNA transfer family protein [Clostridia bacterium]
MKKYLWIMVAVIMICSIGCTPEPYIDGDLTPVYGLQGEGEPISTQKSNFDRAINNAIIAAVGFLIVAFMIVLAFKRDELGDMFNCTLKWVPYCFANGIIFGRLLPIRFPWSLVLCSGASQEGHVCVISGTGAGKTSTLIDTIRHFKGGTLFALDISGDIAAHGACKNKRLVAPEAMEHCPKMKRYPYNIFAPIDEAAQRGALNKYEAIQTLAFQIIPETAASDVSIYYQQESRNMLTGVLTAFYDAGYDMCDIAAHVIKQSAVDLLNEVDKFDNAEADKYLLAYADINEKTLGSIKSDMDNAIRIFASPRVASMIHRPSPGQYAVTPQELEKVNVFLGIPKAKITVYAPVMRVITGQVLDYLATRPFAAHNVLLALDEFGVIGAIHGIDAALAGLRKNRVRVIVLAQSKAQLAHVYGENALVSMLANFRYKLLLNVDEIREAEYWCKYIGTRQRRDRYTGRVTEEWRIAPERLGRLGDTVVILHQTGYKRVRKNFYWRWWK